MRNTVQLWTVCLALGAALGCAADTASEPAGLEMDHAGAHDDGDGTAADGMDADPQPAGTDKEPVAQGVKMPPIEDADISSPSVVLPDTISHAPDADGNHPELRGRCDIDSGFPGDDACIPPPPEDEGFQIHIGPRDYDNTEDVEPFLLAAGDENSECWTFHTPNDEEVVYQTYVLSGRAGTHHIINTMFTLELEDGGFRVCADPGIGRNPNIIDNLPGASKPYMPRGIVAPEDEHLGRTIPANATAQADMHYFNITDKPIVREFWMNIYYAKNEVTERADQIRGMGGLGWTNNPIPPGADEVFQYECPIKGDGRIVALLGHYHAQGKRFTAHIRRKNGDMEKVFEMYDYLDPAIFEYNSVIDNPDFSPNAAGAVSGILEVEDGDTLLWECHIQNDLEVGLRYVNEVVGGEMCNIWGSSTGIEPLNCLVP